LDISEESGNSEHPSLLNGLRLASDEHASAIPVNKSRRPLRRAVLQMLLQRRMPVHDNARMMAVLMAIILPGKNIAGNETP
jgi:hypothetical protein